MSSTAWMEWLIGNINERTYPEAYIKALQDAAGVVSRTCTVEGMGISPVKSFGMVTVPTMQIINGRLHAEGFADRAAMLVSRKFAGQQAGRYQCVRFSQAEYPELAQIQGRIVPGAVAYAASNKKIDPLHVTPEMLQPPSGAEVVRVKMTGSTMEVCEGYSENGPITAWVRSFLATCTKEVDPDDIDVLLSAAPPPDWQKKNPLEDVLPLVCSGAAVHIINEETVTWMNNLMPPGSRAIKCEAFRYNLLLKGLPPNAEDLIGTLSISGVEADAIVHVKELCRRCSVPCIDISTGQAPDKEPQRWLLQNRPGSPQNPKSTTMGIYANVDSGETEILMGATCTVHLEKVNV